MTAVQQITLSRCSSCTVGTDEWIALLIVSSIEVLRGRSMRARPRVAASVQPIDQPPPISPVVSTTRNSPFMLEWISHQNPYCMVSRSELWPLVKYNVAVFPGST
jgi:hypothetical protein